MVVMTVVLHTHTHRNTLSLSLYEVRRQGSVRAPLRAKVRAPAALGRRGNPPRALSDEAQLYLRVVLVVQKGSKAETRLQGHAPKVVLTKTH